MSRRDCFCGCGYVIPRRHMGIRTYNTRGRQVMDRLDEVATMLAAMMAPEAVSGEMRDWLDRGSGFGQSLADVIHGEGDIAALDEGEVRTWQAEGRDWTEKLRPLYAQTVAIHDQLGLNDDYDDDGEYDWSFLEDDDDEDEGEEAPSQQA